MDDHLDGFMKGTIDQRIERENAGLEVDGGADSWHQLWRSQIKYLERRDSDKKYIQYIINTRRKKGLPEIFR